MAELHNPLWHGIFPSQSRSTDAAGNQQQQRSDSRQASHEGGARHWNDSFFALPEDSASHLSSEFIPHRHSYPRDSVLNEDEKRLAKLGYTQEVKRIFSTFTNFGLAASMISILLGIIPLYVYGIQTGGKAIMPVSGYMFASLLKHSLSSLTSL
jgi:hypothetical protein